MTNYTDEQIRQAANQIFWNGTTTVCHLRAFLEALPDQQDEWEQCRFEDVKDTDLNVRFVFDDGSIIQGKPHMRCLTEIDLWTGYVITQVTMTAAKKGKAEIYRIPAPVTRPNPEQYPIILAYEWETDDGLVRNPFNSDLFEWSDQTNNYQGKWNVLTPEIITDWDPLEIASKEMTADD